MKSLAFGLLLGSLYAAAQTADWPGYLGGDDSGQYSPLTQITAENVANLEVAWIYHTGDAVDGRTQIQCNPLIIDGTLYGTSPGMKVFALHAATGEARWIYDPFGEKGRQGAGVNRGLAFWDGGDEQRIFFASGANLFAIDAKNGNLVKDFGDAGVVDLRHGLGRDPETQFLTVTSPGIVYQDRIIIGMRLSEALPASPGHIRAYDVHRGEIVWTFHTIPQPGQFGYDTWPFDAYTYTGGANNWGGMSLDEERGIVYVPTGAAAYDFYGADRPGDNLFANTLIALNADTGERIWHFQMYRHDLWDRDLPAPPNLLTVTHDGKRIDAVAQITKSAHVFVFNRETGEPLFPIEEVETQPSDLPYEHVAPAQPVPVKPPPFSRQEFNEEDVTERTPEAHKAVLDRLKRTRRGKPFIPPSEEGTLIFPGFDGGGEWGGAAVDPESAVMYANGSEMPWILTMIKAEARGSSSAGRRIYASHCLYCHGVNGQGDELGVYPSLIDLKQRMKEAEAEAVIKQGRNMMPAFPYLKENELKSLMEYLYNPDSDTKKDGEVPPPASGSNRMAYLSTGYHRFVDPDGYPAIKPPWGTLNAIDLNKGEILWKVPLGDLPEAYPGWEGPTGTEQYGGPVVTKGGLVFIAATKDERIRAFDKQTGKQLWEAKLPAAGYATPSVYAVNGRQYVVIACGGGKIGSPSGDAYVAFALPRGN